MASAVKVFRVWGSPFSRRVEIGLKLKGVEYEIVEEDLDNKSEQLLEYNPIHKKIPVLVHDGKPVVESLVILEYIDETWKENPLLPSDPYERAQLRFWAKFIDEKVVAAILPVMLSQGEETQKRVEELHGYLTLLEKEIVKKKLFGGNKIGLLDILGLILVHWLPLLAQVTSKDDMNVITREKFPASTTGETKCFKIMSSRITCPIRPFYFNSYNLVLELKKIFPLISNCIAPIFRLV